MSVLTRVPIGNDGHPLTDVSLLVAMGCYEGVTHVNKFGSIVDATSNTVEDVWDAGGTYVFPATALMTHVSQTTDQAAARSSVWHLDGLDANYLEVSQDVTLDGTLSTTAVALATPLMRINRMYLKTSGLTLTSTVRLHNAAESQDYADIQLDHNQTLNAIYTVPAGFSAFMTGIYADYVPTAAKNPDNVHFHVQVRRNAYSEGWRVGESFGVTPGNSIFTRKFGVYTHLPEKTDIRITVRPEAKNVHAHASFDLILIDDILHRGLSEHLLTL